MSAARPLLVFDGDCPVCTAAVRGLVRTGLVPEPRTRAYQELEGADMQRVWEADVRNEMVAFDPLGERTERGLRALLWLLTETWLAPVARLLSVRPFVNLATLVYRTASYNRRILAPTPPRAIACACDPDFRIGYRLGLIVSLLASSVLLTVAFGLTVDLRGGASSMQRAVDLLALAGGGWVLCMLIALRLPFERYVTWLGHLCVTMNVGLLVLVPVMLLSFVLDGNVLAGLQVVSVCASFATMLRMQMRRARAQALGPSWPLIWSASLALVPAVLLFALGIL